MLEFLTPSDLTLLSAIFITGGGIILFIWYNIRRLDADRLATNKRVDEERRKTDERVDKERRETAKRVDQERRIIAQQAAADRREASRRHDQALLAFAGVPVRTRHRPRRRRRARTQAHNTP